MWDAGQFYAGVRSLAAGRDPYAVVANGFPFPLFYPLPALLVFAPFAALPELAARVGWAMFQGGVLAWSALRYRPVLLVSLLSASYLDALVLGQWSPLFTAAALVPALGFVWAAKPSIGGVLFAAFPSPAAAVGVVAITVASLFVLPEWPRLWLDALRHQIHTPPILRPGGVLLLLALLRWRHREARLVAALALCPVSTGLYETLPLFLVPRRRRDAYLLAVLTLVAAFISEATTHWQVENGEPLAQHLSNRWPFTFGLIYVPALVMVLRLPRHEAPRPSVTSVSAQSRSSPEEAGFTSS
jgi:hypothetical protein